MLNIKKYRERLGISQAELARRIGLPRQTLNNYELGTREAVQQERRREDPQEREIYGALLCQGHRRGRHLSSDNRAERLRRCQC